jgi:NADPH:quinone reductase-like Zn-dependent oxidoreductase
MSGARAVTLRAKAADIASVAPEIGPVAMPRAGAGEVVVEIEAAGVNPSDAKAAIGMMPYAVWPRISGRDYAGRVVEGPAEWLGADVFGSSGDLGIKRDGTHTTHLRVEADALVRRPPAMTAEEAAGVGVPFVTAWEGFTRAGLPERGDTVVVLGANGKVGQAAIQIATWRGARAIGVVRRDEPYSGHASAAPAMIDASKEDVGARVRELTDGRGAEIVYNTVGDPFYAQGVASMAKGGRQIFISAVKKIVEFDIFAFYRGKHVYVGVDTISLSSVRTGAILRALLPGFAGGHLKPYPIRAEARYPLDRAADALKAVLASARDRVLLLPR